MVTLVSIYSYQAVRLSLEILKEVIKDKRTIWLHQYDHLTQRVEIRQNYHLHKRSGPIPWSTVVRC